MINCPVCNAPQDVIGLAPGGGPLHYCPSCGQLSIVDPGASEGLRRPTKEERNAAASSPEVQAARAQFLKLNKPVNSRNRRARYLAGFTKGEFAVLLVAVAVVIALVALYVIQRE